MSEIQALIDDLWDFADPAGSERRFRMAIEQSGDELGRLELRTQLARTLGLQHRFDEAHALLNNIERELPGRTGDARDAPTRIRTALERGRLVNAASQPDAARPHFEAAWQLARDTGLDALAVDAAHMIAIVAPTEESLDWNRRALELAESSTEPRARRWRGSLHNNLGWTHHDRGEFETALAHFQTARDCRQEAGHADQLPIARWCVARCLRSLGRLEEALEMQAALHAEMASGSEPDGFIFEELAECLHLLGRTDEARPHYARAFELLSRDPWLADREPERLRRLRDRAQPPQSG